MKRAVAALAGAVLVAGGGLASADPHAEAVVLFDQGIKDMKAGRLDKACPELQASLDLVRDSGTKGALARCHGLAGRVATAWLLWRELADTAPTRELRADAAAQATKLEPRLPRYTIRLARAAPKLAVQINGRSVATNVPVAVPIDPGRVSVSASGQDTEVWTRDYTAAEGQTLAIDIPELAPRVVSVKRSKRVEPRRDASELADRRHRRHVIAFVIGGVALGVSGAGTYFGLDARSKYDDARQLCGGKIDQCPTARIPASQNKVDDARTSALWSTVMFGAVGALAITAAVVWATAPSDERRSVAVVPGAGPGSVGIALGGVF